MGNTDSLLSDPLTPLPPREAAFDVGPGAWVLSRYADVAAAFREPTLSPAAPGSSDNFKSPDTETQQSLRARVLNAFSTPRLHEWQTRLERISGTFVSRGPMDLVSELAEPWCLRAAEIVTGSSPADRQCLLAAARIVSAAAADPLDHHLRGQSAIASAQLDQYFDDGSIPMAGPAFVALSQTVACLLANGWLTLLRHPIELAKLRARTDLVPRAVEEILRYACLPQAVFRFASSPLILCARQIARGDRVILQLASANRDPQQFADPNRFNLNRRNVSHLSLGFGPHSCVGAALIRMTVTAATQLFVERFGDCELCSPVAWKGGNGFRSPAGLHVR